MKKTIVLAVSVLLAVSTAYAKDNSSVGNLQKLQATGKINVQIQNEKAFLQKLKAQQQTLPQTLKTAKHCPLRHAHSQPISVSYSKPKPKTASIKHKDNQSRQFSFTPPGRAGQCRLPAYKVYSATYKVPPPPAGTVHKKEKLSSSNSIKILPDAFIKPSVITKVVVSNTDVNRIVSPEPIEDVVYSKEKGLMVHFIGKNAFIKFVIKENPDGTYSYIEIPSEVYVVTPDAVYTMILTPKNIEGRTIRLTGGNLKKIRENKQMFSQLPYEKQLIKIIKSVYTNNIPPTWDVIHPQKPKPIIIKNSLFVTPITLVSIEGTGYLLKEYKVTSNVPTRIKETDFINVKLAKKPKAVALTKFNVSKDDPAYLFIVARGGDNEQ